MTTVARSQEAGGRDHKLAFQCCFCGRSIEYEGNDPCKLVLVPYRCSSDQPREQDMFCHLECLRRVVFSNVPLKHLD